MSRDLTAHNLYIFGSRHREWLGEALVYPRKGGGGVVPYMGHIGMFHSEGYDFQAVYSGIGCRESLGSRKLIG